MPRGRKWIGPENSLGAWVEKNNIRPEPPALMCRFITDDTPAVAFDALIGPDTAHVTRGYSTFEEVDLPGRRTATNYVGLDPFEMTVDLVFDGYQARRSIEPVYRVLEEMASPREGKDTPPVITLAGAVPHTALKWWISDIEETSDPDWLIRVGGERFRTRCTVTLLQRVEDKLLRESIGRSRRSKEKGVGRTTTVRRGEDSFSDVSKRVYKTRSKAIDLARANGMALGRKLKAGTKLRVP